MSVTTTAPLQGEDIQEFLHRRGLGLRLDLQLGLSSLPPLIAGRTGEMMLCHYRAAIRVGPFPRECKEYEIAHRVCCGILTGDTLVFMQAVEFACYFKTERYVAFDPERRFDDEGASRMMDGFMPVPLAPNPDWKGGFVVGDREVKDRLGAYHSSMWDDATFRRLKERLITPYY